MIIKYRKGYPTKRSMQDIIDKWWDDTVNKPRISGTYGIAGASLIWDRSKTNEQLERFVQHLKDEGIGVESYRKYESPLVGVIILKQLK